MARRAASKFVERNESKRRICVVRFPNFPIAEVGQIKASEVRLNTKERGQGRLPNLETFRVDYCLPLKALQSEEGQSTY